MPSTGKTIWQYSHKPAEGTRNPCCGNLTRGVAILGDKLFLAALDAKMIALDAKTGKELWTTQVADYKQQYAMTVAPIVVKDKVIAGVAGGEHGVRGFLAAYDVNTGKEVWRFNTVPGPGEAGYETWLGKDGKPNDSYLHGGAPIWVTGSYDPETNLTMWGTGNAGPDYNGDNRIGDNLYSSSVIAIDADTGKLKWHYQFSPHDEFDWDATQVPVLADIDFPRQPAQSDDVGESEWRVLRARPHQRSIPVGQVFYQDQLVYRFRRKRPADARPRSPADAGRNLGLPRQPGRNQLVQPVV